MSGRVALDALAVQHSGRGVSRVLRQLVPLLVKPSSELDAFVLTTREGAGLLGPVDGEVVVVPHQPKSIWEQTGLPWYAGRHGADRLYTHSECGPLWGPGTLLHVPEDPYVRWASAPVRSHHERLRRSYQRTTMATSIERSARLVVSCRAIADQLAGRFGARWHTAAIVPLGVDPGLFYPDQSEPTEVGLFHLGSNEPRDQTHLVIRAYASALKVRPDLPDLVIAGNLGGLAGELDAEAASLGIRNRSHFLGRVDDAHLRRLYSQAAVCVQPARYEGFGLQPLEALACGAPLVVFADPAVYEVVGQAATVVEDKTAAGLATAIVNLWADSDARAQYRTLGPERAARFTWDNTAGLLGEVLGEMARGPRHPTRISRQAQKVG